jgi:heptosyltransferase-2
VTLWNRIEQHFKGNYMGWLEKIFRKDLLQPYQVDFAGMKRILVIRQHDMLGDFLLATPVLRGLRQYFPQAHLGVLVREYFADAVIYHPFVDEVLIFQEHGTNWTAQRMRFFWQQLRNQWDLAVVLNTVSHSFTSDLLAHFSGARYILGSEQRVFPGCSGNFFYNLIAPCSENEKHQSERNLDIVRYIGVETDDTSEVIHVLDTEREAARAMLKKTGLRYNRPIIGMHVGAGKLMNRWPVNRFADLAQRLHDRCGAEIVLFWGSKETSLSLQFRQAVKFEPVKIAPTGLRELAAFFTQCDAVICNDTGVMHICAAAGVPLVAVFGPTNPKEWKPIGDKFLAIRGEGHETEDVSVEQVLTALSQLLRAKFKSHQTQAAATRLEDVILA